MMQTASGENPLLRYWRVLERRRWAIFGLTGLVVAAALAGSFLATPMYRATATLEIQRQNPDILTFQDLSRMDYSWAAYADFYQTQYRILGSDAIAREAAARVDLLHHPDLAGGASEPGLLARLKGLLPRRKPPVELSELDRAALLVRGGLEVAPVRNSHLVEVSWVSPDAELAARVANAVVDSYIHYTLESKFSTSDQATEFLVEQIATLKHEINQIEEKLQEYGEAKRIVSIDDSSNITLRALSDVANRRTQAQTALAQARAAYDAVREAPPEALPEVLQSRVIADLKAEYAATEAVLSEKGRLFRDDWPEVQALRSKLDQVGRRIEEETRAIARQVLLTAESEYRRAADEVRELDRLLEEQETAAQTLRRDAVEYANLQSEVENKRDTLDALITRQNEMALSTRLRNLDATSSNIRIVGRARVPHAPFSPNLRLNLLLALVLGGALGVGAAFLVDQLDSSINGASELEAAASVPVLAVVPHYGDAAPRGSRKLRGDAPRLARPVEMVVTRDGRSVVAEAYRDLRTSILLSGAGAPPRVLVVTSSLPEEGKSATSVNLALVLAQLGRKVLLVDSDLRRPRLHKVFDRPNERGLSGFLSGMIGSASELISSSPAEGLDLLTSGPIPPNPSELLNSPRLADLVEASAASGYDHVLIDSPPALSVSDPVVVSRAADAVVLVVRAGKTPRQSVVQACERLRQAGLPLVGAVLNDASPDRGGYGGGYRYYSYGSGPESESSGEGAAGSESAGSA